MERFDYLIVGGGVAGTTAAETIRELKPESSVAIISDEPHPLYSRVLLPHYVRGQVPRERVFLRTPADYPAKRIALMAGERAISLDAPERRLRLAGGQELGFEKLLIASGGEPRPLGIPGERLKGVSRFQTIEDADQMLELLAGTERALVAGSGFIALEYLDILAKAHIPTALILRGPAFFHRQLEAAGAAFLHEHFHRCGIEPIFTDDAVTRIEGDEQVRGLRTERGQSLACDFIGFGIGLERNVGWLEGSGVVVTPHGVETDECLATAVGGVFAAGDVAACYDVASGTYRSRGNWTNAFLQGKTAGANMAGRTSRQPFQHVSSYSIKTLGYVIQFIGDIDSRPGVVRLSRRHPDGERYEQFSLRGDTLVGAVFINHPEAKATAALLIQAATPVAGLASRLADPSFDLASVAP